jgi:hypothetical protein
MTITAQDRTALEATFSRRAVGEAIAIFFDVREARTIPNEITVESFTALLDCWYGRPP